MKANTCSKRVIIHEGLELTGAISAALAFDTHYVKDKKIKTGIYHSRTFTTNEGPEFQVYHTSSSIIVTGATPKEDPQVKGAENLVPEMEAA